MRAIVWVRPGSDSYQFHRCFIGQNKTTWPHLAKRKAEKYRGEHRYWCTVSAIIDSTFGLTA